MLPTCVLCNSGSLSVIGTLPHGVTSDSKLWPRAGQLLVCKKCGHVQKNLDPQWHADACSIYANYRVHAVASVHDHTLFDSFGQSTSKSAFIIQELLKQIQLPASGKLLDVGCGSGGFLQQFNTIMPAWSLNGMDITTRFCKQVMQIPGVKCFYTDYSSIKTVFDFITLNDVFEHIAEPSNLLRTLRGLLKKDGMLFIRCPNFLLNPFDLAIVDHCSHYTPQVLLAFLQRHGFCVQLVLQDLLKKEIVIVASLDAQDSCACNMADTTCENEQSAHAAYQWLTELPALLKDNACIYGSSVAATWSAGFNDSKLFFFVDDDIIRQGKLHLGRKIVSMQQVPATMPIFLAFPPFQAQSLLKRLTVKYPEHTFIVPVRSN